jgi:PAS domain S-box-containing protein
LSYIFEPIVPIKDFSLFFSCLSESKLVSKFINQLDRLFMIINDQGYIVWWNQACEKAGGYTLAEVSCAPFWEILIKQSQKEELKEKFFTWLAQEESIENENEWVVKAEKQGLYGG